MADPVVINLTVDARGINEGTAAYDRMKRAAQAAADRVIDAHNKVTAAADKSTAGIIANTTTVGRSVKEWDRLRAIVDPVAAAMAKAEREMARAAAAADNAVKQGIATQHEAARAYAAVRAEMEKMIRTAQSAAVGPVLENAFIGIGRAAQEAVRQSDMAWRNLGRGVTEAATQAVREGNAAWQRLGTGVTAAVQGAVRESNAAWANLARGISTAANEAARQADMAWQRLGAGVTAAARAAQNVEQQYREVAAALDPAIRRTQELARTVQILDQAWERGLVTEQERNRLLVLETQRTNELTGAIGRGTGAYRAQQLAEKEATRQRNITNQQALQVQFTINDVIASAQSGQKPLTILLQQGPQLTQAFAGPDGRGGLAGAFRALVTPATLALAAIAALGVGIIATIVHAATLEGQARRTSAAISAMGGQSGLTTAGVVQTVRQQAALPGFGRGDTQDAAGQLLGNRLIQGAAFRDSLELARNFALIMGQDLPAAMQTLLPALTGGADGLKRLDQQFGILTVAQIKHIESLERQGRTQEIVRIGIDAMSARFKNGETVLSDTARAWDDAKKSASGFFDSIAEGPVAKAVLTYLQLHLKLVKEIAAASSTAPRSQETRQAELQKQLERLQQLRNAPTISDRAGQLLEILPSGEKLREAIEATEKALADTFNQQNIDKQTAFAATLVANARNAEDFAKKVDALLVSLTPLDQEIIALGDSALLLRRRMAELDEQIASGQGVDKAVKDYAAASKGLEVLRAKAELAKTAFEALREENDRADRATAGGASEADIARAEQARQIALQSTVQGRPVSTGLVDVELRRKELAGFVAAWDKATAEARQLSDIMSAVDDAIGRATNPARIEQLTRALKNAADAAYAVSSSAQNMNNQAVQDRLDADEVARAHRTQRALIEARNRAVAEYMAMPREKREATDFDAFVKNRVDTVRKAIGGAIKDLFEDLDAGNRGLLAMAEAYGKSLANAYREAARQAGLEAERLQGADPKVVERAKLQEQALQGLQSLRSGNLDVERQVDAQVRLTAAELKGVSAVKDAERANQLAQFAFDARARSAASGSEKMIAAVEAEIDRHDNLLKRLQDEKTAQEALQLNRQFDPQEALRHDISRFEELERTGKLTTRAAQGYLEEMYVKAGRAGDSWLGGAMAGLLDFARQARNVGDQVASALVQAFSAGTDALAKLLLGMDVNIKTVINDIKLSLARAFIGSTLTGPIAGLFGGLLGGLGLGGVGGGQAITVGGQQYVPISGGAGGGIFGSLFGGGGLGGGGLLGSLFGGGGLGGGAGFLGGIGSWLNQPLGISLSSGMGPVTADALGGLGSLTGMNVLGGLGGIASGIFGLASGNPIGGVAGLLGGALSFIPGLGGLGTVVGLLGGLLGGLTKKKPKAPQEITNIGVGDDGLLEVLNTETRTGGTGGSTKKGANAATKAVNDLLRTYDLTFGSGLTGGWLLNSKGKNTGDQFIYGEGFYGGKRGTQFGAVSLEEGLGGEEAVGKLIASFFKRAAGTGNLLGAGATETVKAIFKNAFDGIGRAVIESAEDVKDALDFAKVYDELKLDVPKGDVQKAVEKTIDDFRAFRIKAEEFGLDIGFVAGKQQTAIDDIAKQFMLQFTDALDAKTPEGQLQIALRELDKQKELDLASAAYLETVTDTLVDIVKIEEFYGQKRIDIEEQILGAITENYKAAIDAIRLTPETSTLTPRGRLDYAENQLTQLEGRAYGGESIPTDEALNVGQQYLVALRAIFASGEGYASGAERLIDLYRFLGNIPGYAEGGYADAGLAMVGERGPELVRFKQPAFVYDTSATSRMLAGAGGGVDWQAWDRNHERRHAEIGRLQEAGFNSMVNELRALRAEVVELRREQANANRLRTNK